jgi:hypothetical protein
MLFMPLSLAWSRIFQTRGPGRGFSAAGTGEGGHSAAVVIHSAKICARRLAKNPRAGQILRPQRHYVMEPIPAHARFAGYPMRCREYESKASRKNFLHA